MSPRRRRRRPSPAAGPALATLATLFAAACGPPPAPPAGSVPLAAEAGARAVVELGDPPAAVVVLDLPRRHWVRLAVRQQGVDVVARVTGPAGDELLAVDSPSGRLGREPVAFLTARDGLHRLRLEASAAGTAVVEVLESRRARRDDGTRFAATRALARGTHLWIDDETAAAEAELRRALGGFAAVGGDPGADDARRWLAGALGADGRPEEAAALLAAAARGFAAQGETHEEAKARSELAACWRDLGRPADAERELLLAREAFAAADNREDLARALDELGVLWRSDGFLGEAAGAFEEALGLRQELGDPCAVVTSERRLGSLYSLIGRDGEALDYLEAALAGAAGCEPAVQVDVLIELGWARHLVGEDEAALAHLDAAGELAREAGHHASTMGLLDRRATVLVALGRLAEARLGYEEALAVADAAGDRSARTVILANIGGLIRLAGDAAGSLAPLREAIAGLVASEDAEGEAFTRLELARALRALGRDAAAGAQLERAVARIETVRSTIESATSRSFFLSHRREPYDELIDLLMRRAAAEPAGGHHLRALEIAERARARSLLDSVARPDAADGRHTAPTLRSLMSDIERLDRQRDALRREGAPPGRIAELDRRLRRLALYAERLAAPPSQPAGRLLTAAELPGLLDADTDLLVFSLGAARSYAWLVDAAGSVEWFALPAADTLDGLARRAARELAASGEAALPEALRQAAAALGRQLLGPIAPRLSAPRLAVVPDGALHLVPLQALPLPGGGRLLDRAEVVVVPSPSALAAQRARPARPHRRDVLVVADPVFTADDHRVGAAVGRLGLAAAALPDDLERSLSDLDLERLRRLRWTRREAQAIVAAAGPRSAELLVDFAADRGHVLAADLADFRVLHFATHALLHPSHPQLSGVVLSLVGPDGEPREGFLRAWEIAALDLPAELVVLSACNTGLGREVRTEGLIGLPQAFVHAGARRVVVSHWPVQDRATAELMGVFYDGLLRRRLPPATALAEAQRALRADPRWSAPYYWAGFSLQGDWRPLGGEQNRR